MVSKAQQCSWNEETEHTSGYKIRLVVSDTMLLYGLATVTPSPLSSAVILHWGSDHIYGKTTQENRSRYWESTRKVFHKQDEHICLFRENVRNVSDLRTVISKSCNTVFQNTGFEQVEMRPLGPKAQEEEQCRIRYMI